MPKTTNLGRKKRKHRQRCKERYARAREDAQLSGVIPTVPEGAVRDEVAPAAPDAPLPHLVRQAIRENWATPDGNKPAIMGSLLQPFYDADADTALRIKCFMVLFLLDQMQYEQDRLKESGNANVEGGAVAESMKANLRAAAFVRAMIEREQSAATDKPAT